MTLFGKPDQIIVEAFLTGRNVEKATTKLYELYWENLVAFIISNGARTEDAGDYAQESILRLLDKIQKRGFDLGRGGVKTYLFAIAKHYTWQQLKLGSRIAEAEKEFAEWTEDDRKCDPTLNEWVLAEHEASAWEKFERLGEFCRRLLLKFLDGGTAEHMYEELGMSSAAHVRVQKKRCLDKLSK